MQEQESFQKYVTPILNRGDSETWHNRAKEALHLAEATPLTLKLLEQFAYQRQRFTSDRLHVMLGGIEYDNPLMVGAGWDKTGMAVQALHRLGFAGVEVGTVLAYPQPGNPKPRQFAIGPGVVINRLGFNSPGAPVVATNLTKYRQSGIPIGVSVGKNKDIPLAEAAQAHAMVIEAIYPHAAYIAINVSSPNTPGLRTLQDKEPLTDIIQAVNNTMDQLGGRKPVFIKIAPELTDHAINDVITVVADNNLTGIIATNTTINPSIKARYGETWQNQAGGLSGNDPAFRALSTAKIRHIYSETNGQMEIIGVGGVHDVWSVIEKIKAGATVVQIVTAIREKGPTLPGKINHELDAFLEQEGIGNLEEIRGQSDY